MALGGSYWSLEPIVVKNGPLEIPHDKEVPLQPGGPEYQVLDQGHVPGGAMNNIHFQNEKWLFCDQFKAALNSVDQKNLIRKLKKLATPL